MFCPVQRPRKSTEGPARRGEEGWCCLNGHISSLKQESTSGILKRVLSFAKWKGGKGGRTAGQRGGSEVRSLGSVCGALSLKKEGDCGSAARNVRRERRLALVLHPSDRLLRFCMGTHRFSVGLKEGSSCVRKKRKDQGARSDLPVLETSSRRGGGTHLFLLKRRNLWWVSHKHLAQTYRGGGTCIWEENKTRGGKHVGIKFTGCAISTCWKKGGQDVVERRSTSVLGRKGWWGEEWLISLAASSSWEPTLRDNYLLRRKRNVGVQARQSPKKIPTSYWQDALPNYPGGGLSGGSWKRGAEKSADKRSTGTIMASCRQEKRPT